MAQKLGVIGAGVMGQGVAYRFARHGHQVTLIDVSEAKLNEARQAIRNIARHDMMFNRPPEPIDVFASIEFSIDLERLASCSFVIENVTENLAIKQEVYARLRDIISEDCIVAVNTSAISITKIGSLLQRPANVIGIHFMNPVHLKHTVEVIRGYHSAEAAIETAQATLRSAGIDGVVVNDYPGFVSNRVLMLTVNEAIFTVQDGVASVADVDRIFRECFGHKMGPLETADLIGLDTILYTLHVLFDSYNDPKFRPAPLLQKMVDANLHGRKSGEGFYKY